MDADNKEHNEMPLDRPGTYGELYTQWFARNIEGADPGPETEEVVRALRAGLLDSLGQLQSLLADPERDGWDVSSAAMGVHLARFAARPEDIPALIQLARQAREVRGPGSQLTEEYALGALVEVADESTLPFLAECLRYSRPRDAFSGHRRAIVLKAIATLALAAGNDEALSLLEEGLRHRLWRVRRGACEAVGEVARLTDERLLPRIEECLGEMSEHDRSGDVRWAAKEALSEAGLGDVIWF
jgi:HEAT repeat protein